MPLDWMDDPALNEIAGGRSSAAEQNLFRSAPSLAHISHKFISIRSIRPF